MKDSGKSKAQLLAELEEMRQKLQEMVGNGGKGGASISQSEDMFSKAFTASPDMVIISSVSEGKYIEVNEAFTGNTGYSREELIGKTLKECDFFATAEDEERMMAILQEKGRFSGEEFSFRVRSGEIQKWLCSAEVFKSGEENLMIAVASNITGRKQMEEALDDSRQILAIAFQSSPQAISIVSLKTGYFIEVNDSQARLSGYSREELIGHSAYELKILESVESRDSIYKELSEKGRIINKEVQLRRKDGQLYPVLLSSQIIKIRGEACAITSLTDLSERWEMERALRDSEAKFSKAFSSSPTAICLFNIEDSRFIDINASFMRFTGYRHDEIIGHTPDELNLWVNQDENQNMGHELQTTGKLVNQRVHSRMKSGEIRTGLFSAQTFEMNGKQHMILSINDITDQVKAEEAIAREAALRKALIHDSRDAIVIIDQDARVYDANRKFCEMLGYTPEEIKNLHVWDWDVLGSRELLLKMINQQDEKGDHFETRHRRKDGTIFDVEMSTNGAVIGGEKLVFCVHRDITERKRIEKALRESEDMLSKAFHTNPEITAITTMKDGSFIDFNENLCARLGYTREELMGRSTTRLNFWVNPKERDEMLKTLRDYGKISKKEYQFRTKSGDIRTWLFSAQPLTVSGEPCLLSISIDITEQKVIEEKAREAENLQEVERLRRELLSNVSHELRTPLAGIKGFATMLLDYGKRLKASEKREYLETIDKNADRMVELIEQLIEMSRLGAGMVMIRRKATDIRALCKEVIKQAKKRALDYKFNLDIRGRLPQIEIDDRRIIQVIDHLIENAVKFSQPGTEILLCVSKTKDDVIFSVKDQGTGVDEKEIPFIFDRMFSHTSITNPGTTGPGLGLSICKGLVEAHGGKIWFESKPGVGSKVSFTLPLKPPKKEDIYATLPKSDFILG